MQIGVVLAIPVFAGLLVWKGIKAVLDLFAKPSESVDAQTCAAKDVACPATGLSVAAETTAPSTVGPTPLDKSLTFGFFSKSSTIGLYTGKIGHPSDSSVAVWSLQALRS